MNLKRKDLMALKKRMTRHFAMIVVIAVIVLVFTALAQTQVAQAQELNQKHLDFIEKYADLAISYGAKYDIPWETAMGIAIYESQSGTSYSAIYRHNFHGISSGKPGKNRNFASDEEGWEGFYKNLAETPCYTEHQVFQYRDNPDQFFDAIVRAGYNANHDQYIAKVGPFVKAVVRYRDAKGWPSSQGYKMLDYALGGLDEHHPRLDYAIYTTMIEAESTIKIDAPLITSGAATIIMQ